MAVSVAGVSRLLVAVGSPLRVVGGSGEYKKDSWMGNLKKVSMQCFFEANVIIIIISICKIGFSFVRSVPTSVFILLVPLSILMT